MSATWKEEKLTDESRQRRCFVFPVARERIKPQHAVLGVAPGTQSLQNDVRRLSIETEELRSDHARPLVLRRKRCTSIDRKIQALSERKQELKDVFTETICQTVNLIKDRANSILKQTGDRLERLQQELQRDLNALESTESLHSSSASTIDKIRHSMETGRVLVNEERCLLNKFFEEEWIRQEQSLEDSLKKHILSMQEVCHLLPSDQATFASEQRSNFRTSWNSFKEEIEQSWHSLETTFTEEMQSRQERVSQQVTCWKLLQLDNKVGSLVDYLKGVDFWKPADIVVAVSEIKALILGRNNQFLEWIHKTSCVVKTTSSQVTFDLMTSEMSQQISSWKQQNCGLLLSLKESITTLNKGGEDYSQLLSEAEEELQQYSEKLSIEDKVSEGRRIIKDRQSCFKRLEYSAMQCLRKQLLDLKRLSIKYIEFLKQFCSLKRKYQQEVNEAKEVLEKDLQDVIDSIEECFVETQASLSNKIKEMESCDEVSSLDSCIGQLDSDLENSKTKLHTFEELWRTKTAQFCTVLEEKASEWTQSLKCSLFIKHIEQDKERDVSELVKCIHSIACEVDLSDLEGEASIGQEERELEACSDFMGSEEGQELQKLYELVIDSQVDDALSQGLRFLQNLTLSDASSLTENHQQEMKFAEELFPSKVEPLLNKRASALDQLKLQDAIRVQKRILNEIATGETSLNNQLLEMDLTLQKIKTDMKVSLDQAQHELDRFLANVQKHQTRMINARSLQVVENEETKLQAIDEAQFLQQIVSPLHRKLDVLIQNLKENLEQIKANPLSSQATIDQKIKVKHDDQLVEAHKQVENARIESQENFDHFHKISKEKISKLKYEILDLIPVHKAEVEVVQDLDKLVKDFQSELKSGYDQRKLYTSQLIVHYEALQHLHKIGSDTSIAAVFHKIAPTSSEIKTEMKHTKSIDVCKEAIQQEVDRLSKVLVSEHGLKLETVEKLSYGVAAIKMAFKITSLLMQICGELFCLEIPEDFSQVQIDVIRYGPLEIINDPKILKDSTKTESIESRLLRKYTDQIKKIGKEFFLAAEERTNKFRNLSQSLSDTQDSIEQICEEGEGRTTQCKARIQKLVQNVISQIEALLNPICRNFGIAILDVFLSQCELLISTPAKHYEVEISAPWDEYKISSPSVDLKTFFWNFITQDLASKALSLVRVLTALESRFQCLCQTVDCSLDATPKSCENRSFLIRLLDQLSSQRELEAPSDLLKKIQQLSQDMKKSNGPQRSFLEAINHQVGRILQEVLEVILTVEVSYPSKRKVTENLFGS